MGGIGAGTNGGFINGGLGWTIIETMLADLRQTSVNNNLIKPNLGWGRLGCRINAKANSTRGLSSYAEAGSGAALSIVRVPGSAFSGDVCSFNQHCPLTRPEHI
jgi:hypothetical protein